MMSYQLIEIVQDLGHPHILVIGDLILDRYIFGDAERISQEAPVILLREEKQETRLGGAANVANMLRGLEAEVTLAGVVGNDEAGQQVRLALEQAGVSSHCLITDPGRPTTVKERYLGRAQNRHPHQILRVDREVRHPLDASISQALIDSLLPILDQHQCVLISDYAKGVCTPAVLRAAIDAARAKGIPVIVDPAVSADYRSYHGATAVTPNRLETKLATGLEIRTPEEAFAAGRRLCTSYGLAHAFITLDSDGIALVMADGSAEMLPTRRREVYDITGAGDIVLAMIGVGSAQRIDPANLGRLANIAGGLEVEQIGVVPISRREILADLMHGSRNASDKVCTLDALERHVLARRKLGQKIVLTNGCFDLLHVGHVTYLEQAAREGDCLIVAVNSDRSVRGLNKAPDRPVFGQQQRATLLAALEAVDYVVVFDELTPHALLARLQPDLLVKGGTYTRDEIVGWELVESYGGRVKALGAVPAVSTTAILERIQRSVVPAGSHLSERKAG